LPPFSATSSLAFPEADREWLFAAFPSRPERRSPPGTLNAERQTVNAKRRTRIDDLIKDEKVSA